MLSGGAPFWRGCRQVTSGETHWCEHVRHQPLLRGELPATRESSQGRRNVSLVLERGEPALCGDCDCRARGLRLSRKKATCRAGSSPRSLARRLRQPWGTLPTPAFLPHQQELRFSLKFFTQGSAHTEDRNVPLLVHPLTLTPPSWFTGNNNNK